MILLNGKAKIVQSREFPVLSTATIGAEGVALVQGFENGVEVVKPSTGAAAEIFMGVSYGVVFTPAVKAIVETFVVPAASPYTFNLKYAPLSGQIYVYNTTTSTAQTAGTPASTDNTYSLTSNTLITLNAARAGNTVTVQYRYSPTVMDLQFNDNLMVTSFAPTQFVGSIGVITQGEVWTDQYNAAVNFGAATSVRMLAGGIFTDQTGANNNTLTNCVITHVPEVGNPFLGLRFTSVG